MPPIIMFKCITEKLPPKSFNRWIFRIAEQCVLWTNSRRCTKTYCQLNRRTLDLCAIYSIIDMISAYRFMWCTMDRWPTPYLLTTFLMIFFSRWRVTHFFQEIWTNHLNQMERKTKQDKNNAIHCLCNTHFICDINTFRYIVYFETSYCTS